MEETLVGLSRFDLWGWLFSVGAFLCGAYLGHLLTIRRDKRKEFNEVLDTVRPDLMDEIESPHALRDVLARDEVELLADLMLPWNRNRFRSSVKAYKNAKNGNTNGMEYANSAEIQAAAKKVFRFLKRR